MGFEPATSGLSACNMARNEPKEFYSTKSIKHLEPTYSGRHDEIDSKVFKRDNHTSFSPLTGVDPITPPRKIIEVSKHDFNSKTYKMDNPRRGICLIFVHENFNYVDPLNGPFEDGKALEKTVKSLGFDAVLFYDLHYIKIIEEIKKVACEDHSEADCLAVAIITRGRTGYLHSKNNLYSLKSIWSELTNSKCPTLAGKPKLFFIQISDRNYLPKDKWDSPELDSSAYTYTIPDTSDFFFGFCNNIDYLREGRKNTENSYIQTLCRELSMQTNGDNDLIGIILNVHNTFAFDKKTMELPYFSSTLTKQLYFTLKDKHLEAR